MIAKEEAKVEESKKAESDFQPPKPDGLEYLPFQRAGVKFALDALDSIGGCLIGDSMGLGKSIEAIGIINSRADIKHVLIVCPNTLKLNWKSELSRWLTRPMRVGVQYSGLSYIGDSVDVLIVNYDCLGKFPQLAESKWDLRRYLPTYRHWWRMRPS